MPLSDGAKEGEKKKGGVEGGNERGREGKFC